VLYLGEINDSQGEAWVRSIEVFDENQGRQNKMAREMNDSQRGSRCLDISPHVSAETKTKITSSALGVPPLDAARIPSRTAFAFTTGQRSSASRRNAEDQRISAFQIKLDFVGGKRECPQLSLLLWCLSVPEALKTDPISGEVRRRK
jgi:hypothetical protein